MVLMGGSRRDSVEEEKEEGVAGGGRDCGWARSPQRSSSRVSLCG